MQVAQSAIEPGKTHSLARTSKEAPQDLKERLTKDGYFDLQIRCVFAFGPAAGIFSRQLIFWTGKEHDPDAGSIRPRMR